jgi:hypothetical protein
MYNGMLDSRFWICRFWAKRQDMLADLKFEEHLEYYLTTGSLKNTCNTETSNTLSPSSRCASSIRPGPRLIGHLLSDNFVLRSMRSAHTALFKFHVTDIIGFRWFYAFKQRPQYNLSFQKRTENTLRMLKQPEPHNAHGYPDPPTRPQLARWVKAGWENVTTTVIMCCLIRCGITRKCDYSANVRAQHGQDGVKVSPVIADLVAAEDVFSVRSIFVPSGGACNCGRTI